MNKTACVTAKLALINAQLFADEKNKEYSRLRMSKSTLRRLSGRECLRDVFINDLIEEFIRLGWHFFVHTDTEFGLIKADRIKAWAKIGASRVQELIEEIDDGIDDVVDKEYERLFGVIDNQPSEGE